YSDINFETNVFRIPSNRAKGKKELVYNLDNYLIEAIQRQADVNNITDMTADRRIFTYTKETPRIHFQSLLKALGIQKLRLHDIRHMLGSTLVQNGVPIADISVMLGHSSIAITEERYANKTKDQATRATNALNSLVE
ncbi:MAG: tyrosine-type recombinase/integrase, partial [Campylobacterota bacterium]|nr:tyrosine-type recombinase/integrase [Campylobacterota bacterium]